MDDFQAETRQILMKNEQLTSCRTCMEYTILPLNICDAEFKYLLDLLNCLLGFEGELINDEYIICRTCEVLLKQLAEFKKTCLKSHKQFCNTESKNEVELLVDKDIRTYLETALSSENEEPTPAQNDDSNRFKRSVKTRSKLFDSPQRSAKENEEPTSAQNKRSVKTRSKLVDSPQRSAKEIDNKKTSRKGKNTIHKQFPPSEGVQSNEHFDEVDASLRLEVDLEETGEVNCDTGSVKEEIITVRGEISEELGGLEGNECGIEESDLNREQEQPKNEPSISDSNDSDCKPLILRIKPKRRYTKRSTHRIKRHKDALTDEETKNNLENPDDPEVINNGNTKSRIKCRLQQFDHEEVLQAIEDTIKPFKMNRECILCGFVASHGRALSVHMTLLHKDIKDNWCSRCNCVVDNLAEHSEGHRNDILKCTFCGKSFNKFFHLKEHLKSHSRLHAYDLESKWYSCKVCPNSYPDEQKLKEHDCRGPDPSYTSKTKKKIKDSRFCLTCNKRVRSLPIHIKHKHNADGALKEPSNKLCSICGKSFSDNSKLTVHMRIHTGECPYKCSYCDKRCGTRNHLVVHERTHTGEKPHICYICGKAFAQSSVLGTHMKIHTGRPEECSVCNQRFCRPAELKLHMRRHTGEKPYLCNNCGLSFHQRSHLVEHVKRHSNERPYKCSFCEKGFKQISVLKAHENIHTGLKPYKCTQCSYSCRQSYSLTVHMKQHSNDTPQPERPHKCLICNKQFSTHSMLVSHANNMHSELAENDDEFSRIETVMDCS